jgi:CO/xanthine dehydrogenase Mo-binding subunit
MSDATAQQPDRGHRILGTDRPRTDAVLKVTGRAKYLCDLDFPGLLECALLKSPHAHARILRIDTRKAEQVPGVLGVLTHKDVSQTPIRAHNSPHHTYRVLPDQVYYVSEQVAAVVAETREAALEAVGRIEVEYEVLPAIFDPEEAMKPGARPMYPDRPDNLAPSVFPIETARNDIQEGLAQADVVLSSRYTVGVQAHNCMETHGTVCRWEDDQLTVWTSTKFIWSVVDKVCEILKLPESKVKVITPMVGGDFGGKPGPVEAMQAVICAIFAKRTGRPVRLSFTREEELAMTHHSVGPLSYYIKGGLKRDDGRPTAVDLVLYSNQGGHNISGLEAPYLGSGAVGVYRFDSCKFVGYPAYCNLNMSGSRRGYGDPEGFWGSEQFVDEMAEAIDMDPFEWRMRWAIRQGDPTVTRLVWGEFAGGDYQQLLTRGAEIFGWKDKWRGWRTPTAVDGPRRRGVGVALGQHITGVNSEHAAVRVNVDGSIEVFSHAGEVGQGLRTAMPMCVAEVLGVDPDVVRISEPNTSIVPRGFGIYASRGTPVVIGAAIKAARDARAQLLERASRMLKVPVDDLEMADAAIYPKSDPSKALTLKQVATAFGRIGVYGFGFEEVPHKNPKTGQPLWEKSNGALFVEVEVDVETGAVTLVNAVSTADAGVVIHPKLARAQVDCGVIWGLGYALYEDEIYDRRHEGRVMNVQMVDYKIPTFLDLSESDTVVFSDPAHAPTPPMNVKGLGENSMVPVAPAIANAVYNAIGVRIKDMPITPAKVLKALGAI